VKVRSTSTSLVRSEYTEAEEIAETEENTAALEGAEACEVDVVRPRFGTSTTKACSCLAPPCGVLAPEPIESRECALEGATEVVREWARDTAREGPRSSSEYESCSSSSTRWPLSLYTIDAGPLIIFCQSLSVIGIPTTYYFVLPCGEEVPSQSHTQ